MENGHKTGPAPLIPKTATASVAVGEAPANMLELIQTQGGGNPDDFVGVYCMALGPQHWGAGVRKDGRLVLQFLGATALPVMKPASPIILPGQGGQAGGERLAAARVAGVEVRVTVHRGDLAEGVGEVMPDLYRVRTANTIALQEEGWPVTPDGATPASLYRDCLTLDEANRLALLLHTAGADTRIDQRVAGDWREL